MGVNGSRKHWENRHYQIYRNYWEHRIYCERMRCQEHRNYQENGNSRKKRNSWEKSIGNIETIMESGTIDKNEGFEIKYTLGTYGLLRS